jgi:hypothetical protein
VRGVVGTGLSFAVGVGGVSLVFGLVGIAAGVLSTSDLRMAGRLAVVAGVVGATFAGLLAIAARGRHFEHLSLAPVSILGAGGGLAYFLFIGVMNGFSVWTLSNGVANLSILVLLGAVAAGATLLLARRATTSGVQ